MWRQSLEDSPQAHSCVVAKQSFVNKLLEKFGEVHKSCPHKPLVVELPSVSSSGPRSVV